MCATSNKKLIWPRHILVFGGPALLRRPFLETDRASKRTRGDDIVTQSVVWQDCFFCCYSAAPGFTENQDSGKLRFTLGKVSTKRV